MHGGPHARRYTIPIPANYGASIETGDDFDVPPDKMTGLLKEVVGLAKRLRPSSFVGSAAPLPLSVLESGFSIW
jgi:hypothetical protein